MSLRLLLVEDDKALRAVLAKRLHTEGYAVDQCDNGSDALDYLLAAPYDGVVLDIMLPGMDGLEVLKRFRKSNTAIPVLLLTARDGVADRVKGLDTGADDYLVKPFSFDELMARVRALLRKQAPQRRPLLKTEDSTIDTTLRKVSRAGREISLTAKEYALLEYFMRNAGQVLTREQIADHVWSIENTFSSNLVDVYVRYLRNKIEGEGSARLIQTVRGAGYTLRPEK